MLCLSLLNVAFAPLPAVPAHRIAVSQLDVCCLFDKKPEVDTAPPAGFEWGNTFSFEGEEPMVATPATASVTVAKVASPAPAAKLAYTGL